MKHLKKFENMNGEEITKHFHDLLVPNPKWDDYITDVFNQYVEIYDERCTVIEDKVIKFFDSLQEEIDDSEKIEIWAVTRYYGSNDSEFIGLAKAYGAQHACIKLALEFEYPDIIDDDSEAWIPEEKDFQNHIDIAKKEIEKWTKIY